MYYDDEYEDFLGVEASDMPEGHVRAYRLNNGDIVTFNGNILLEFEDAIFYEVKQPKGFLNPRYERTGISFTIDELNEMSK